MCFLLYILSVGKCTYTGSQGEMLQYGCGVTNVPIYSLLKLLGFCLYFPFSSCQLFLGLLHSFPHFTSISSYFVLFAQLTVGERRVRNVMWEQGFLPINKNVPPLIVLMYKHSGHSLIFGFTSVTSVARQPSQVWRYGEKIPEMQSINCNLCAILRFLMDP